MEIAVPRTKTIAAVLLVACCVLAASPAPAITIAQGDGVAVGDFLSGVPKVGSCSGALLWDRMHVVTAAHCSPHTGASTAVVFTTKNGTTVTISGTAFVNPDWTGNVNGGNDLSILTLKTPAPVNGYHIYRDTAPTLTAPIPIELAGYGLTGTGSSGAERGTGGVLRAGTNTYDVILSGTRLGSIAGGPYLFDFDDGTDAHDSIDKVLGVPSRGTGTTESMLASGDSGGPSFIGTQLAGIHSFIFSPGVPYDVSQATNSSFGEIGGDTRLANYAQWIDSVVGTPVPEPQSWVLISAGMLALLGIARRRCAGSQRDV
jgi:hypothetical protein